jgi:hypothetical protein
MRTIIIRKSDIRNEELWQGILSALDIPAHDLDDKWGDLTLTIASSEYEKGNTTVIKGYQL